MSETEKALFDEYKRVDNICRDMFSSQSGVSQYIAEMERKSSSGRCTVPSWEGDYHRLKRARWLRNQIAHESFATDCGEEDAAWLEAFHTRLLERRDPLALLAESNRWRQNSSPRRESWPGPSPDEQRGRITQPREVGNSSLKVAVMVLIGLAVATLFFVLHRMMAA